ncbi:MAG: RnfABCDGE type electron transport complex subunit D [Spirochaetales bacterium]|nr:RnfABCDGE type electron transport complex subunit D [Spirochaetales bacterium]
MSEQLYHVSSSPHIRSQVTTASIMRDVTFALLPSCLFSVYWFGLRALVVLAISVISCQAAELLYFRLAGKKRVAYECSAIVTGLLLGMNLPSTIPLWIPVVGGFFAIIVVKELFGGLGNNFMNPALAARCFLLISFAGPMTSFSVKTASSNIWLGAASVDGLSSATPLAVIKNAGNSTEALPSLFDMFFGFTGGVIGETSILFLLLGALYLVIRKVISLKIPLTYILSFSVFILINNLVKTGTPDFIGIARQLCGGGLVLGAFFMATDYVTCPITPMGKIVFGICLGIVTAVFRLFGNNAEGVSYAIIFCNMLVPLIEKLTIPAAFGLSKKGGNANGK